jgi:hypothetical protein
VEDGECLWIEVSNDVGGAGTSWFGGRRDLPVGLRASAGSRGPWQVATFE